MKRIEIVGCRNEVSGFGFWFAQILEKDEMQKKRLKTRMNTG